MKTLRKAIQAHQRRTEATTLRVDDVTQAGRRGSVGSLEAGCAAETMGELYFECPACGKVEHVNDIGKSCWLPIHRRSPASSASGVNIATTRGRGCNRATLGN